MIAGLPPQTATQTRYWAMQVSMNLESRYAPRARAGACSLRRLLAFSPSLPKFTSAFQEERHTVAENSRLCKAGQGHRQISYLYLSCTFSSTSCNLPCFCQYERKISTVVLSSHLAFAHPDSARISTNYRRFSWLYVGRTQPLQERPGLQCIGKHQGLSYRSPVQLDFYVEIFQN